MPFKSADQQLILSRSCKAIDKTTAIFFHADNTVKCC